MLGIQLPSLLSFMTDESPIPALSEMTLIQKADRFGFGWTRQKGFLVIGVGGVRDIDIESAKRMLDIEHIQGVEVERGQYESRMYIPQ